MTKLVHFVFATSSPEYLVEAIRATQLNNGLVMPVVPGTPKKVLNDIMTRLSKHDNLSGVVFSTSGTVGTSKLVVRSFDSIWAEAEDVAEALNLYSDSKVFITTPITHSYGFGICTAASVAGCKQVDTLVSNNIYSRIHELVSKCNTTHYDVMTSVPFVYRLLVMSSRRFQAPKLSYSGGEYLNPEVGYKWRDLHGYSLVQEYGLSEVGIVTLGQNNFDVTSIGTPIPNTRITFTNEGELVVRRPFMPFEYLDNEFPELWTEKGVRTGDIGYSKGDSFYLTGRLKNIILVGGKSVVPEEVESVINAFPDVVESLVTGRPHKVRGEAPVAKVAPKLSKPRLEALKQYLVLNLPKYKVPVEISTVPSLPRTKTGKLVRTVSHE